MTSRPANPEELERLRRLRDGGHLRYVLLHGVVGWGVCTAVLFSLIMSLWEKEPFLKVLSGAVVAFGFEQPPGIGLLGIRLGQSPAECEAAALDHRRRSA